MAIKINQGKHTGINYRRWKGKTKRIETTSGMIVRKRHPSKKNKRRV